MLKLGRRARVEAARRNSYFTQWAAQFFVGAELTRRGYVVSYPLGNAPVTDLQVTSPRGYSFPIEVKGLKSQNYWLVKKPPKGRERFYIFVMVPTTSPFKPARYFVLSSTRLRKIHQDDPRWPGMSWGTVLKFEDRWESLPL